MVLSCEPSRWGRRARFGEGRWDDAPGAVPSGPGCVARPAPLFGGDESRFNQPAQDRLAEFDLKLMDIDSEQLGIPDSEYEVVIEMPSAEFKRICSDLATIGDTVNISAQKDHVKFSASGDIGTANVMIRPHAAADSEAKTTIQVDSPVAQDFALRYMNSFSKASPLADQVVIKLSNELPIVVEYIIENVGKLGFFLAPKIEEDMEA